MLKLHITKNNIRPPCLEHSGLGATWSNLGATVKHCMLSIVWAQMNAVLSCTTWEHLCRYALASAIFGQPNGCCVSHSHHCDQSASSPVCRVGPAFQFQLARENNLKRSRRRTSLQNSFTSYYMTTMPTSQFFIDSFDFKVHWCFSMGRCTSVPLVQATQRDCIEAAHRPRAAKVFATRTRWQNRWACGIVL